MDYWKIIIEAYPELTNADFQPNAGKINIRDNGDGNQYLSKWDFEKPIPEGLKLIK